MQSMTSVAMWSGTRIVRKLPGSSVGVVAEMVPVALSKTLVIVRRIAQENAAEMAFVMISILGVMSIAVAVQRTVGNAVEIVALKIKPLVVMIRT